MGKPPDDGGVQEMMSFAVVSLLDGADVAGIQAVRYPVNAALDFNEPPSLSFFLYNADRRQGVARYDLDGRVHRLIVNSGTRQARKEAGRFAVRWFLR